MMDCKTLKIRPLKLKLQTKKMAHNKKWPIFSILIENYSLALKICSFDSNNE